MQRVQYGTRPKIRKKWGIGMLQDKKVTQERVLKKLRLIKSFHIHVRRKYDEKRRESII